MAQKTDNYNLAAKLELRRYFLRKYHSETPLRIMDCCQGEGVIWGILQKEFSVGTYWGMDVKQKKGRLKIDSSRVLSQPGWDQNVVDIDTYGSPWKHWISMLPNITESITVFLTIGQWQMGVSKEVYTSLGLHDICVPPGIGVKLLAIAVNYLLTTCYDYALIPKEIVEAESDGSARYIGIRLYPQKESNRSDDALDCSEHQQAVKEPANV